MKGDRLLVEADHRFGGIVRFLVGFEDVLPVLDVFVIELRNALHFFPATA